MDLYLIIYGLIIAISVYLLSVFIFDLLLRGFTPLITSRPWVVEQILNELEIPQANPKMIALSTGRSGVFYGLERKYPTATLVGIEQNFFPFFVAKAQSIIRQAKIKVERCQFHRVNVKDADFIYCHLDPDELRYLGAKFKFECKPGAQIISTGFNIPYLTPKKTIPLPDRPGRFNWLSKNQKLFQSKQKRFKKEQRAFLYEI